MPIELILTRQWALHLATPVIVVDQDDRVAFVNDAALQLIGRERDELIHKPTQWLAEVLQVRDARTGGQLNDNQLRVSSLGRNSGPRHARLLYRASNGREKRIDLTSLPLEGQGERPSAEDPALRGMTLGAALLFWEVHES
jgi:PAS domain-containing protein